MQDRPAQDMDDLARFREGVALWEDHIHAFVDMIGPDDPRDIPTKGPLSGMTVGVKDIIDVAGFPTRNGSDACTQAAPAVRDAAVVATLRAAGARIVGKTTTTEFAFTDPTACRNPHDLTRSPGGSSSGSGAAVAAGVVDLALGTQTAGSLCRPAAYCGVVGFKPSYGLLPTSGVTPLAPSFDTVGIIAGSVAQTRAAFAALAPGHDRAPLTGSTPVIRGLWDSPVTPDTDTQAALNEAATALADLGTPARDTTLTADVDQIVAAHRCVMTHEAARAHGALLTGPGTHALKPKFRAGLTAGAAVSTEQAEQARGVLAAAKQAFWDTMPKTGIILTSPVPEGAPHLDGTTGFQDWLTPWTVFGGPLLCLPWGRDRMGRPRAVMLAAPPGQDAQVLALASELAALAPPRSLPRPPDSLRPAP